MEIPREYNEHSFDMEDRLRTDNALFARVIRAFMVHAYRPRVQDGRICNLPEHVLECQYGIVYSKDSSQP